MSRPLRIAIEDTLINQGTTVFDYGCGHGDDLRYLRSHGVECSGWDPVFASHCPRTEADVVNLGYVVNVIEDPAERVLALKQAWALARRLLVVAGRLSLEAELPIRPNCFADGFLTARGTFQKLFEQRELRDWIESSLGERTVAAAPGIFYVFKDAAARETYSASRFTRSSPQPLVNRTALIYKQHKEQFQSLSEFVREHGRIPQLNELAAADSLQAELGSIRRAFRILRKVESAASWTEIRDKRAQDTLVYLALSRFPRRCKFSEMPESMQLDVRAFFGTYSRACEQADALLFSAGKQDAIENACSSSNVGKLTPEALYFHESALSEVPPVLRVYEGCARVLVGRVEGGNVVKLHRGKSVVSYLSYPEFETVAHPPLYGSLVVDLQKLRVAYRDYSQSQNRPILHRKEQFISTAHPHRPKFAKLTRQEENKKLFESPGSIGYEQHWQNLIESRGLKIAGHRLMRRVG
jgi:DNA phosphorothioation-associated putative methyltransferase